MFIWPIKETSGYYRKLQGENNRGWLKLTNYLLLDFFA